MPSKVIAVEYSGTNEVDVTPTEVLALINAAGQDLGGYRSMPHWHALSSANSGTRSAGFSDKAWGTNRQIGTPAGANKMVEVCESEVTPPFGIEAHEMPFSFRMWLNAGTPSGTKTGECLQGIEWGSFTTLTPWATQYANSTAPQFVTQLRYNFTTSKWEWVVWDGDLLLAPASGDCDIQPAFTPDLNMVEARIDYDPGTSAATRVLTFYLNGSLAKTYIGQRLETIGATQQHLAGYFVTNGSNATNVLPDAIFGANKIYQPYQRLWTPPY